LLPVGPVALQPVEQPVKSLGNGARLRPGKTLFHLNGLQQSWDAIPPRCLAGRSRRGRRRLPTALDL